LEVGGALTIACAVDQADCCAIRPVTTEVIVTFGDVKEMRPTGLEFVAGAEVIPDASRGLAVLLPATPFVRVAFLSELRLVLRT
jgi:hypothetical protein